MIFLNTFLDFFISFNIFFLIFIFIFSFSFLLFLRFDRFYSTDLFIKSIKTSLQLRNLFFIEFQLIFKIRLFLSSNKPIKITFLKLIILFPQPLSHCNQLLTFILYILLLFKCLLRCYLFGPDKKITNQLIRQEYQSNTSIYRQKYPSDQ